MRHIASAERWIVEGAAGVALAGLVKLAHEYQAAKLRWSCVGAKHRTRDVLNAVWVTRTELTGHALLPSVANTMQTGLPL